MTRHASILRPRANDGYRTAFEDALRGGAAIGRVVDELTDAGILRSEGTLLMPLLPEIR